MRYAALIRLLLAVPCMAVAGAPPRAEPAMNEPAPAFVVTALDGTTFDLAAQRGKVVLVSYWATWCAPCLREMPVFEAFYRRHHGEGLEMIAVSVDRFRDVEAARRMGGGFVYPAALARDVTSDGLGKPEGVPLMYVVDRRGVVRDRLIAAPAKLLDEIVLPLLAASP